MIVIELDREEFCKDVVTAFMEGYVEEWVRVDIYDPERCKADIRLEGVRGDDPPWISVHLDVALVEKGIRKLMEGPHESLHENYRKEILGAFLVDEAGDIDYERSTYIVQMAVYGSVEIS